MKSEKVLCIYHKADLDGICSAAIVYDQFKKVDEKTNLLLEDNVLLYGMDYGDEFPWSFVDKNEMTEEDKENCVPYNRVIMVDFSLSEKDMERLNGLIELIWIDHHASVINRNKNIQGIRNLAFAACELTYMYFCTGITYINEKIISDKDIPLAVSLLGRYDVWDHDDKKVIPFQYGMQLYDIGPCNSEWRDLFVDDNVSNGIVKQIIENGELIRKYQANLNKKYVDKYGFHAKLEFEGKVLKVLCVNKGFANLKIVQDSLLYNDTIDLVMFFVKDKYFYRVSLYTEKEIDVSYIAKSFGGGGHMKASGFMCNELVFDNYNGDTIIDME